MSTIDEHLAKIEKELQAIARDGHLTIDVVMARFVNAMEYDIFEAKQEIENARQHNRDGDSIGTG